MTIRELLVIRHAKSSWDRPGDADFDRRLNQRGVADGSTMAKVFAEVLPRPDRVLCSPARRTRDTLAFLIPDLVDPRVVEYDDSLYLADAATWLAWILAAPSQCKVLMLVGHNPGLTDLVNRLKPDGEPELDNLPTLGAAHFHNSTDWAQWGETAAEGVAILRPRQFRDGGSSPGHA
ncbi:MAG: histidine phosphatase family protein [Gammaproteobacteria bacterium]|nr:histidine phosphatase family protein [Gammaproteobacteria bacterium]